MSAKVKQDLFKTDIEHFQREDLINFKTYDCYVNQQNYT
jgi:hypothetical protein